MNIQNEINVLEEENKKIQEQIEILKRKQAEQTKSNIEGFVEIVPEGIFLMGTEDDYQVVKLTDTYEICDHPLTAQEWYEVMGGDKPIYPNRPKVNTSWDDFQELCKRLSELDPEYDYRLPTEAEWEYAATSKGKRTKYSGTDNEEELHEYAVFNQDSICDVKTKKPNALGLYDMSGLVWEWCQDSYGHYSEIPEDED